MPAVDYGERYMECMKMKHKMFIQSKAVSELIK